jgi:hypothetical protein
MRLNLNNGFVRLAIVFAIGWWIACGPFLYRAVADVNSQEDAFMKALVDVQTEELIKGQGKAQPAKIWAAKSSQDSWHEADARLSSVEEIAVGGFILIPLAFASVVWVRRGFRQKQA